MTPPSKNAHDRVLILGASGFVGRRLVHTLTEKKVRLRLFVRNPSKIADITGLYPEIEVITGDLLSGPDLKTALEGVNTAYYLIHSMGGKSLFRNTEYAERDQQIARSFMTATEGTDLKRIIYLGALGETGDSLSEHLKSRAEMAEILSSLKSVRTTVLRAAIIIGAGGSSFEMLRYLVERLPAMVCPRWIDTRIQPIAVRDVLGYLAGCLFNNKTAGETFDICGPDVLTYREMMQQYAEARGLAKRSIVTVPVLTPLLSAYWVDLVTPVPSGVAHPLIEGLRNEVVCRDSRIRDLIPLELTPYQEAVKIAFSEETEGPGITGW